MAEEQYRDLLRRIQQKAENYREQQQQTAEFQHELEAVKEVYGLTDQELSEILKEVEQEVEEENEVKSKKDYLPDRNPLALNITTLCLLLVGMMLLFVQPLIGIVFLGGVLALRWVT
jgi:hypothetical protein